MKYVSIDIETTGLDPINHNTLSIAAIIEDTNNKMSFDEIPKLHLAILHDNIQGSLVALNMNKGLIETIMNYQQTNTPEERKAIELQSGMQFLDIENVALTFSAFLKANGLSQWITPAGKNFGTFDKLFLEQLPDWKKLIRTRNRIIDPAILFVDWRDDSSLPSLNDCKKRAGIEGVVSHNALEDAWDVIQVLRKHY